MLSRRAIRTFVANSLAALGVVSGCIQLFQALGGELHIPLTPLERIGSVVAISVIYGAIRSRRKKRVSRTFKNPNMTVRVKRGDLFNEPCHLVIGFNDCFDTDVTGDRVIHHSSVQAQFLARRYQNDVAQLDADLATALAGEAPVGHETRATKALGKLARYPPGIVAVVGTPNTYYFCVAYGRMSNDLVIQSDSNLLWASLSNLWRGIYLYAQREPVAMPILGTALARIDALGRESILKMILLSFVAASRPSAVTSDLTIVIHPSDFDSIDMREIDAFLSSL